MTTTESPASNDTAAAEEIGGRLFTETVGALHLLCVYLGQKLGLFRTLAAEGPLTAAELSERTGLDRWYVREWLQAEATAGLVTVDGAVDSGHCALVAGVEEALIEETSPFYMGALGTALVAAGGIVPKLAEAFRTGDGIAYAEYGPEAVEAQAALNRPSFVNSLVAEWLPAMPEVLDRLRDDARPACVADFGCGVGWAAIELARTFPHVHVDGIDSDDESISRARRNAVTSGVADRVAFEVDDIGIDRPGSARYDVVFFFECLHDLGHPVEALIAARNALTPGGTVIVMDERVAESLPPPGDPIETFFATVSVLWCLPQGRVDDDSEATGTVMRPDTLRDLATKAGYGAVDIVPIEHPFWRFYRLIP